MTRHRLVWCAPIRVKQRLTVMEEEQREEARESEEDVQDGGTLEEEDEEEEAGVDLKAMADDYAKYLIVNSKQDQTALDDKIDGVYTRVDEFKQQLYFLHQNIASNSKKTQELQENAQQLATLFHKIDQIEGFLNVVSRNVDQLEVAVSQAEKDLEPSKLRKVFSSLPGLGRKSAPKPDPTTNWQPPKVFKLRDYFPRVGTTSPTSSITSSASFTGHTDEHSLTQQQQERMEDAS